MRIKNDVLNQIVYLALLIVICLGLSYFSVHAEETPDTVSNYKDYPFTIVDEENDPYIFKEILSILSKDFISSDKKCKAYLYTNQSKGKQRIYLYWEETSGSHSVTITGVSKDEKNNVIISIHRNTYDPHTCDMKHHCFVLEFSSTDFQMSDHLKIISSTTEHIDETVPVFDENGHIDLEKTIISIRKEEKDPVEYNLKFNDLVNEINPPADTKKKQDITIRGLTRTVKHSKLRKKVRTIKIVKVKNAVGKIKYEIVKSGKKLKKSFKINPKTGKVTIRKGTKKGRYRLKIKITVTDSNYQPFTKTVKAKIIVR